MRDESHLYGEASLHPSGQHLGQGRPSKEKESSESDGDGDGYGDRGHEM